MAHNYVFNNTNIMVPWVRWNKHSKPSHHMFCRNPSLGLATKARGCKVAGQEGDSGVTSHAPGSAKSVREWTLTLINELPCWELESRKDSRIFKA
jgi:hypothetical protein